MSFCTLTQQPPGLAAFSRCQTAPYLGWAQAKQCYLPPKYLLAILSIACLNTEPVLLLTHQRAWLSLQDPSMQFAWRWARTSHICEDFLSSSAPNVTSSHTSIAKLSPSSYRAPQSNPETAPKLALPCWPSSGTALPDIALGVVRTILISSYQGAAAPGCLLL